MLNQFVLNFLIGKNQLEHNIIVIQYGHFIKMIHGIYWIVLLLVFGLLVLLHVLLFETMHLKYQSIKIKENLQNLFLF